MVVKRLLTLNPDIACLQELGTDEWETHYKPALRSAGYDYESFFRSDEEATKRASSCIPPPTHGLCIIWKRVKFTLVDARKIAFDHHPLTTPSSITPITKNIGQVVSLLSTNTVDSFGLVVSNHHLYWRSEARYERLRQAWVMLEEVVRTRRQVLELESVKGATNWIAIMGGDWNVSSKCPIHGVLSRHEWDEEALRMCEPVKHGGSDRSENPPPFALSESTTQVSVENISSLSSPPPPLSSQEYSDLSPLQLMERISKLPNLLSLYAAKEGQEPPFTHYIDCFQSTLDYLFLVQDEFENRSCVVVEDVLAIPEPESFHGSFLPNEEHGSDHVPVMVTVRVDM